MKLFLYTIIMFASANICCAESISNKDYPGDWDISGDVEISRLIASYKIKKCGEYRYKYHVEKPYTYLLQCSGDGKKWSTYYVRLDLNLIKHIK